MPIVFVMQSKCLFTGIWRPGFPEYMYKGLMTSYVYLIIRKKFSFLRELSLELILVLMYKKTV